MMRVLNKSLAANRTDFIIVFVAPYIIGCVVSEDVRLSVTLSAFIRYAVKLRSFHDATTIGNVSKHLSQQSRPFVLSGQSLPPHLHISGAFFDASAPLYIY